MASFLSSWRQLDTDYLAEDMSSKSYSTGGKGGYCSGKGWGALLPHNLLGGWGGLGRLNSSELARTGVLLPPSPAFSPGSVVLASPLSVGLKAKDQQSPVRELQPLPKANAEAIDFLNSLSESRQHGEESAGLGRKQNRKPRLAHIC